MLEILAGTAVEPLEARMTDLDDRRPPGTAPLAHPHEQGLVVVLLDSQQALAEALATVLGKHPLVTSAQAAIDPAEATAMISANHVDVLIVGTDSDTWDALGFVRAVATRRPELAVVAMSSDDDPEHVARTLLAGAVSWVSKRTGTDEMAVALVASARGESRIPPAVLRNVLHRLRTMAHVPAQWTLLQNLTGREREVLEYAVLGLSRNDIADELGLSVNTVRTHLQHILAKLSARTTLEAVALFLREQGRVEITTTGGPHVPGATADRAGSEAPACTTSRARRGYTS